MRYDWKNDTLAHRPCRVHNLDTGEVIRDCQMADEETGEYVQYLRENGKLVIDEQTKGAQTVKGKARLRVERL